MHKWAYDMSNEELLKACWDATVQAGVSNSGLVMGFGGNFHQTEAFYLYGVALSRLNGKRPPFAPGDKVCVNRRATYYCSSVNHRDERSVGGEAKPNTEYGICRVFYEKVYRAFEFGFEWTVSLEDEGLEGYRFLADRFEKIEQKPAAA